MSKGRAREKASPATASPARPAWKTHAWRIAAVWALALIAYGNSFGGGLVFDSRAVVQDDPRIRAVTPENVNLIWSRGYWFDNANPVLYRPLTLFSYLLNYAVLGNGGRTAGYHWVNFLLHAFNAALLYALGLAIFGDVARATALAALWAVHPVLTESVTNIVGRADLLAAFGVLAGLVCHTRAAPEAGPIRWRWLGGIAAASAIGIFSKENAIVLIALMLVYDLAFRKANFRAYVACYVAAIWPVAVFLYQRSRVLSALPLNPITFVDNPLVSLGFLKSRLTAVQVIGRYLLLMVWPAHLSYDYSFHQVPLFGESAAGTLATLAALAGCLAIAALALRYRRERAPLFFGAMFFLALAPVANVAMLIGTIMAERFLYLPAAGFAGVLAWAIFAVPGRLHALKAVRPAWVIAVLCLAMTARTYARNADWDSPYALFSSGVQAASDSYKTHSNLAHEDFKERGNADLAIAEGDRALAILAPLPLALDEDPVPYTNIGAMYRVKGDVLREGGNAAGAAPYYRRSLEILTRGEAVDRARAARILELNRQAGRPQNGFGLYQLYQELAETYNRVGEPKKAIAAAQYGLTLRPAADLFDIMAESYTVLHDPNGAAIVLMEGLVVRPDDPRFASELVDLFRREPSGCALGSNGLNMECAQVRDLLCIAARRVIELDERAGRRTDAEHVRTMRTHTFGCPML